jgi:flagellar basal-body rod modification protein FlgD
MLNLDFYFGEAKNIIGQDQKLSRLAQFNTHKNPSETQEPEIKSNSLQSNQALQASALVGRKVLIRNDRFRLDTEVSLTIDICSPTKNIKASIYKDQGILIKTIDLGTQNPGLFQFVWDGKNEDGEPVSKGVYQIKVHGMCEGYEIALSTLTFSNVDSISLGQNGEGLKLNVAGVGPISLDQVRQIRV